MCNLELDLSKRHAPVFRVPETAADGGDQKPSDGDYLRRLVYDGAAERYGEITAELRERIDYELGVVIGKGFASYFLIVWDCVRYAREHGIPVGARGSGCSSVIAYCLRISTPDPIRYGLYFERFMDPDRDEMPDIDLDICQNGRAEILEYVRQKYGHVAQIITFGTLKARAAVKDVARVLGLPFDEANELTKLIPTELKITLDKALKQEPELKKRYLADERIRRIIDIGRRLEGVARNAGVHAAGVVVADQPLVNFLPLYKSAGQDALVTQFDGPTVEKVGLLKMDFLGLRTLTTLERARQLAQRRIGREIDLERINLADQRVYELFARGDTKGVFQFESGGMRDVIMRMKPNRIEDLIAANALFRPGPMEYIPDYIDRKHGKSWTTPHPTMTEVLQETYGIMVYQEQVSRLVNRLGGVELKAAFRLAKAISKKKTSMIEQMRAPFLDGCERSGVQRATAEQVFEDILKFGGYAFNKAHSTGYALVAYQTAWMKTYFPVEFMAALLTFEMSSTEKVAEYRDECNEMGVVIEPPDVNASEYEFVVGQAPPTLAMDEPIAPSMGARTEANGKNGHGARVGSIRFGLGAIKGVGAKAVASVVEERAAGGPFRDLFDFCERVDLSSVNRGTIEAMIDSGAFDKTGAMRKALCDALDNAMTAGQRAQADRRSGQMALFGAPPDGGAQASAPRISTAEWSEAEMLRREKAVLGFYVTKHPLASHQALLDACATASIAELSKLPDGRLAIIGGIVSGMRTLTTRAGKPMGIVTLEDLTGKVEAVLFSEKLSDLRPMIVADALLFLDGEVDRKREEPSFRINNVIPAASAAELLAKLCILRVTSQPEVSGLVQLLRQYRGSCPVHFEVVSADGVIAEVACGNGLRVACSEDLLGTLLERHPQCQPRIMGPSRRPIPLPRGRASRALAVPA
jgi:DNA polymerase-3 subunit alpha